MKRLLLILTLLGILTQAAFADEAQEGQQSEWTAKENFASATRQATVDVIDSILTSPRVPAATTATHTADTQTSGTN